MKVFSRLATAAVAMMFMSLPAVAMLARNAPTKGTETTVVPPTAPAPAIMTIALADAKPATTTEQTAHVKKVRKVSYRKINSSNCPWPPSYDKSGHREYQNCVPFDQLWGIPLPGKHP